MTFFPRMINRFDSLYAHVNRRTDLFHCLHRTLTPDFILLDITNVIRARDYVPLLPVPQGCEGCSPGGKDLVAFSITPPIVRKRECMSQKRDAV